jgi:hypothetical protein
MIKAYTVVSAVYDKSIEAADHETKLEDAVNRRIADGWQPHGSLTAANKGDIVMFFQPLVRYAAHEIDG